uniref:Putative secreted protein n=1 Tax=Anopheles triannulatus TaxID=58253 RepID=A0A2M4B6S0_9DIPT
MRGTKSSVFPFLIPFHSHSLSSLFLALSLGLKSPQNTLQKFKTRPTLWRQPRAAAVQFRPRIRSPASCTAYVRPCEWPPRGFFIYRT